MAEVRSTGSDTHIHPAPGDKQEVKPISARPMEQAEHSADGVVDVEQKSARRKRVQRQRSVKPDQPEWEQAPSQQHANQKDRGSPLPWLVAGGLLGLTLLAIGAWVVMSSADTTSSAVTDFTEQWEPQNISITGENTEEELTEEVQKARENLKKTIYSVNETLKESEAVFAEFLAVKKVEDFRKMIRFPDRVMPLVKEWYKNKPIGETSLRKFNYDGRAKMYGVLAIIAVQMSDFSIKEAAIEKTPDGYKIDWESWVGWTEMDWDKLFEVRPVKPKTLLVRCNKANYYNRQFSDDNRWLAVQMANPQSDRSLYGYVDRQDPKMADFITDINLGRLAARIKIRYPENSVVDNQVIITEYLSAKWAAAAEEGNDDPKE